MSVDDYRDYKFRVGSYLVFFWSNENNEPIHVHIVAGKPSANTTKIWITSKGGCIVANNNSGVPSKDLNILLDVIAAQHFVICNEWKKHFNVDEIKYYC
jgi:hypothetical protein